MALFTLALVLVLVLLALNIDARQLYAWGVNDYGQLGLNETYVRYPQIIPAYKNLDIVDLKASGTYHMATASDGKVYVCGNNWYGGLGLPISSDIYVSQPRQNPALKNCKIYVGKRHGNAVCGGKFFGWGVQSGYVTGISTGNYGKVSESLPIYKLGSNVADVIPGSRFSILTLTNGTMVVAGDGEGGVLGLGDTKSRPGFVKFDGFTGISSPLLKIFPSHAEHVCAISESYSLYCWGSNSVGQLGLGDLANRSIPTLVSYFEKDHFVVQVSTGLHHTLALTASGRVFAWGLGANGALGNGVFDNSTFPNPVEITFLKDKNVVEVVAGLNFNFVRTNQNQWYSWGAGSGGVLGTLTDRDIPKPILVPFLSSFNITHILTASTSRSVYGWFDPSAPTLVTGPALVNECLQAGKIKCSANAHCQDTDRSAVCACDTGYSGDPSNCQDINECLTPSVCIAGASCNNLPGSYTCTCPANKPIGDGKSTGTGCSPLPTPPPTRAPTPAPTLAPTPAPTLAPTKPPTAPPTTKGSSTTSQTTTDTISTGPATSSAPSTTATVPLSTTSSGSTGTSATTNPDGSTTGADVGSTTNPASTTSGSSTTRASTNGRTNLYQTLFGARDDIVKHEIAPTTESFVINNKSRSLNHDKGIMIGVAIAFGVVIALLLSIIATIVMNRRPPPS